MNVVTETVGNERTIVGAGGGGGAEKGGKENLPPAPKLDVAADIHVGRPVFLKRMFQGKCGLSTGSLGRAWNFWTRMLHES